MAEPSRTLPQAIGQMTILWNDCQAIVFALFFRLLGVDLPKAKSIFFSITNDRTQRSATSALLATSASDVAARASKAIDAFGGLSGARNAFVHASWHFPEGTAVPTNWLDTWAKQIGGDPLKKCEELIANLEQHYATLKGLEQEMRALPAQDQAPQDTFSLPLQQGNAQTASSGLARQQGDAPSQSRPHQPSDQK